MARRQKHPVHKVVMAEGKEHNGNVKGEPSESVSLSDPCPDSFERPSG